jgi:Transposase DDE domain
MASIAAALDRIKLDPLGALGRDAVEEVCRELGYVGWRQRELDPATTLALFVQQVVHGNSPCTEVRHIAGKDFSASAWCQARSRLPLSVYQSMLTRVCDAALPLTGQKDHLWRGHRAFAVDGSSFSMPDTPELREAFGGPQGQARGCGFPVAHLLVMFNVATGLLVDAAASAMHGSDVSQAAGLHAHLDEGDVLIGDDAFAGWAHFALLLQAKLHALFPNHHRRIVDFTPRRPHTRDGGKGAAAGLPRSRWIERLGMDDQLVEWFKPESRPAWMTLQQYDALPDSIIVREIRRNVRHEDGRTIIVTVVTTLLDPDKYPADAVVELRMRRWEVETNIRHLKTTMGLDVLRCKSEDGVRKELAVFCLVYNLVRVVMLRAAARQKVNVDRISFADALKWMRHARPGDTLRDLVVNPPRPGRVEPRCRKRRPKEYDLMNKPRDQLRKALRKQRKSV